MNYSDLIVGLWVVGYSLIIVETRKQIVPHSSPSCLGATRSGQSIQVLMNNITENRKDTVKKANIAKNNRSSKNGRSLLSSSTHTTAPS